MKIIKNAKIYVEGKGIQTTNLLFDEKIRQIGGEIDGATELTLPNGALVLPGFIDEHIHGAGGADCMDASVEKLAVIADTVAREGTTCFLATTMTQSPENILAALSAVKNYREQNRLSGAEILGVHLEGPFIAAAHKGAQPLEYVARPSIEVFENYQKASGNSIKIVSLAPEEDGALELISRLKESGVTPSIGHSGAKNNHVQAAMAAGATNVTHTFNAQTALHHREIGVVGSALLYDQLNTELICDGIHVSVPAMQLLAKCKPAQRLILITDAMRAKGLGEGVSELGGQTVIVKNGEARLEDGTLAGSVLLMNNAVKNLHQKVGVDLLNAVDAATINPAKVLGVDNERGSIREGKRADFAVLDEDFNVVCTIRGGEIIYQA